MSKPDGLILLNKPPGVTSFSALGRLKRELGTGKVGHTGTLDKFAEGLIVALSGKMTKLVPQFTGMDKEYEALIRFGEETDTLDPEGKVIAEGPVPEYSRILESVNQFTGKILQRPPAYSAVHINGKRAYERVRSGEELLMPEREVEIFHFDLTGWNPPFLTAKIRCSKGTYIRSLARDLAAVCGSRAHLQGLKRIAVGPYFVGNSVLPDKFQADKHLIDPWTLFDALPQVSKMVVEDRYIKDLRMGKTGTLELIGMERLDGEFALFSGNREMIALINCRGGQFSYSFVC